MTRMTAGTPAACTRASTFLLPLSSTAHQMFLQASSSGHGREDDSAVVKIFPGIGLP